MRLLVLVLATRAFVAVAALLSTGPLVLLDQGTAAVLLMPARTGPDKLPPSLHQNVTRGATHRTSYFLDLHYCACSSKRHGDQLGQ